MRHSQTKFSPLIPLQDYLRIHSVIKSVLDSVDAHTAHACLFFSIAGAAILRKFYGKEAVQVAGAAFYLIHGGQRNVMCFATLENSQVKSSDTAFHAWVQCDDYVIDFMTPILPEMCKAAGHSFTAPRHMFQKKWSDMAPTHEHLDREGDFYLLPNLDLTVDLRNTFLQKPANTDLVNVCLHWYKRPPRAILPKLMMHNDLGELTKIRLKNTAVAGVW